MALNLGLFRSNPIICNGKLVEVQSKRAVGGYLKEILFDESQSGRYIKQEFKLETKIGMIISHRFAGHDYFDNGFFEIIVYEILFADKVHYISLEDAVITQIVF